MFDGRIMGERLPSETKRARAGPADAGITDTARPVDIAEVEQNLATRHGEVR